MFTNRWPPQKSGADSFKRLLGGGFRKSTPSDTVQESTHSPSFELHRNTQRPTVRFATFEDSPDSSRRCRDSPRSGSCRAPRPDLETSWSTDCALGLRRDVSVRRPELRLGDPTPLGPCRLRGRVAHAHSLLRLGSRGRMCRLGPIGHWTQKSPQLATARQHRRNRQLQGGRRSASASCAAA